MLRNASLGSTELFVMLRQALPACVYCTDPGMLNVAFTNARGACEGQLADILKASAPQEILDVTASGRCMKQTELLIPPSRLPHQLAAQDSL